MSALVVDDLLALVREAEHAPPGRRQILFTEARIRMQRAVDCAELRAMRVELERLERAA